MSSDIPTGLSRAIADLALFLEFSEEPTVADGGAVESMEQLATDLQSMNRAEQRQFAEAIRSIAPDYGGYARQYLENFPETFGLEDT